MLYESIRVSLLVLFGSSIWSYRQLLHRNLLNTYSNGYLRYHYRNLNQKYDNNGLLSMSTSYSIENNNVWWKDGLTFGCTGCGKCCQNEGEVWFDTEEFYDLCTHLNMPFEIVLEQYSEAVISGWIKMKSKDESDDACIFLQDDRKTCSVYQVRPVQCRSYPYWPNLLSSKTAWDAEAVVPDDQPGKHWTPETGGCEGFNNEINGTLIPFKKIVQNNELYKRYTEQFPLTTKGQYPNDRNRLLVKLDVIKGVMRSAREWTELYSIKYQVFPFCTDTITTTPTTTAASTTTTTAAATTDAAAASSDEKNSNIIRAAYDIAPPSNPFLKDTISPTTTPLSTTTPNTATATTMLTYSNSPIDFLSKLRYRVFFGSEIAPILNKIKYEKLVLSTEKSHDISSTVLILPFAFNEIEQFELFQKEWLWYVALTKATETNRRRSKSSSASSSSSATDKSSQQSVAVAVGLDDILNDSLDSSSTTTSSTSCGDSSSSSNTSKPPSALVKRMLEKKQQQLQSQKVQSSSSSNDDVDNDNNNNDDDDDDDDIEITFHHPLFQFKSGYLNNNNNKMHDNNSLLSSSSSSQITSDDDDEEEEEEEYDARHFYRRSPFPVVVLSRKSYRTISNTSAASASASGTISSATIHHTQDVAMNVHHIHSNSLHNKKKNDDDDDDGDIDVISIPSTLASSNDDDNDIYNHHHHHHQDRRAVSFQLLQQAGFDELSLTMEKILRLSLSL